MATKKTTETTSAVTISAPNLQVAEFNIVGTAPLVQHKFSAKSVQEMMAAQMAGGQARSKRTREPKDFDEVFRNACHYSEEGWIGFPAPAIRSAMIDACRLVGYKMTFAKLSVFTLHDGLDRDDGTPLVRILDTQHQRDLPIDEPAPERHTTTVRLSTGVADVRVRPMWREWGAVLRIQYDADQFSLQDVSNLLQRAGMQVGIGEGRPNSKSSHGQGWGTFTIKSQAARKAA